MACSRPIGFQPCNSLWFRANFGLQLSMELHSPRNSLSLSLRSTFSLSFRSTFSFYSLLRSTFPSNSLYGVHLSRTHTLSLYGVHFPPTLSYGIRFPPTLSTDYIFLQLSTEYLRFPVSVSVSLCLCLSTEYIFCSAELWTEFVAVLELDASTSAVENWISIGSVY